MKKGISLTIFIFLLFIQAACSPSHETIEKMLQQTAMAKSTLTITPIATQISIQAFTPYLNSSLSTPSEITLGIWNDTWGFNRTITIIKAGGEYKMKEVYSDGSSQTITLEVKLVGSETRLYEMKNAAGDYMVIQSDNHLAFYDNQGFIYEIESSSSSSSSSSSPSLSSSSSSSSSSSKSTCNTLWDNLDQALLLSGGETTDLTVYYTKALMDNDCFN